MATMEGAIVTLTDWAALAGMTTGAIGAVAGVAGLVLNWLTRRDLKLDRKPVLVVSEGEPRDPPDGWALVTVSLRSRSSLGYSVTGFRVLWPMGAKLARRVEHWRGPHGEVSKWIEPEPTMALPFDLEVKHAGSEPQRQMMGTGEEHQASFLFSAAPSIWRRALFSRNKARSDSSHRVRALFMVELTDQNAVISAHRRTVRLTIRKADAAQSSQGAS